MISILAIYDVLQICGDWVNSLISYQKDDPEWVRIRTFRIRRDSYKCQDMRVNPLAGRVAAGSVLKAACQNREALESLGSVPR
jgi:hypothetical protein